MYNIVRYITIHLSKSKRLKALNRRNDPSRHLSNSQKLCIIIHAPKSPVLSSLCLVYIYIGRGDKQSLVSHITLLIYYTYNTAIYILS